MALIDSYPPVLSMAREPTTINTRRVKRAARPVVSDAAISRTFFIVIPC